jgi:hypothetical protein
MLRSRSIRTLLAAILGCLFVFAAWEPVMAHCDADDDADGACCYCLCTQALDAPDSSPVIQSPELSAVAIRPQSPGFCSLTFCPPTPPPQA